MSKKYLKEISENIIKPFRNQYRTLLYFIILGIVPDSQVTIIGIINM